MKDSFILYTSFYKPIARMSNEQLGKLFRAIFQHNLGEDAQIDDDISVAWGFFENQFDIDEKKRQEKIATAVENGKKGGYSKHKKEPNPTQPYSLLPDPTPRVPKSSLNENVNVNVNENVNENVCVNNAHALVGKDAFGKFKNVFLRRNELEALQMQAAQLHFDPSSVDEVIESLSCKLADGSTQSNYHYATLRHWLSCRSPDTSTAKGRSKTAAAADNVEQAKAMLGI